MQIGSFMTNPLRLLVVEDSEDSTELLLYELKHAGYDLTYQRVDRPDTLKLALSDQEWDIAILDYHLPQLDPFQVMASLKEKDIPVIVVSAAISDETAASLMKSGASDFLRKDATGRLIPIIQREISEVRERKARKKAEAKIRWLAYHDPMTQLPNHTFMKNRLLEAMVQKVPFSLLMVNADNLREINDTLGYKSGDLLFCQVVGRLQGLLSEEMLLARLRGNELGLFIPGGAETARLMAQTILSAIEASFTIENLPLKIEVSIGIVQFPDHASTVDMLVSHGDIAMHAAQESGSGYAFYLVEQDTSSARRLVLIGELRTAIDQNQLRLFYQPKIHLRTGQAIGVEALVRWQHPREGLLAPAQFLPAAERTGLIDLLAQWTLWEAIHQNQVWLKSGVNLPVAVNLSARNLRDSKLPEQIAGILETRGVSPAQLEIEVTESSVITNPDHARVILRRLSEIGIRLSIDDFGTGYSSLLYLKELPMHKIKIDKVFISNLMNSHSDAAITRSVIDMGHNLGLDVIGEGVEDQPTLCGLMALGCDMAQGYYMSRPIPADQIPPWVENWNLTWKTHFGQK